MNNVKEMFRSGKQPFVGGGGEERPPLKRRGKGYSYSPWFYCVFKNNVFFYLFCF